MAAFRNELVSYYVDISMSHLSWQLIRQKLWYRYDVIVDVAPEVKWVPEDGYKNLKIVVEIDKEIDAQTAAEQELRHRQKALGALRIVTDRGLQVNEFMDTYLSEYISLSYLEV